MKWMLLCLLPLTLLVAGCPDKDRKSKAEQLASAAQMPSGDPVPKEREKTKWKKMPSITVDNLGAYIGGERAHLDEKKKGLAELKDIVSRLPIGEDPVEIVAQKKTKVSWVATVVFELGEGGATEVTIKTPGRGDLPNEITVVPEKSLDNVPGCSISVAVNEKLNTGVWAFKGGLGQKHVKGFAGPDITNTSTSVEKRMKTCNSPIAFFGGSFKREWQHVYNLGALLTKVGDKQIEKLVLLADEPVAGRAVKLRK